MSSNLQKAKEEALWGLFVADALAMPVHWYYDPNDIKDGYGGWLTGYREPAKRHPSSILTISAVGRCIFMLKKYFYFFNKKPVKMHKYNIHAHCFQY